MLLQCEVKHRAKLPALIVGALGQAARYTPGAVPLAVVSERGGPQLACLYLIDFARLMGLDGAPELPRRAARRRGVGPERERVVRAGLRRCGIAPPADPSTAGVDATAGAPLDGRAGGARRRSTHPPSARAL